MSNEFVKFPHRIEAAANELKSLTPANLTKQPPLLTKMPPPPHPLPLHRTSLLPERSATGNEDVRAIRIEQERERKPSGSIQAQIW
jgi:hypothetical protein